MYLSTFPASPRREGSSTVRSSFGLRGRLASPRRAGFLPSSSRRKRKMKSSSALASPSLSIQSHQVNASLLLPAFSQPPACKSIPGCDRTGRGRRSRAAKASLRNMAQTSKVSHTHLTYSTYTNSTITLTFCSIYLTILDTEKKGCAFCGISFCKYLIYK